MPRHGYPDSVSWPTTINRKEPTDSILSDVGPQQRWIRGLTRGHCAELAVSTSKWDNSQANAASAPPKAKSSTPTELPSQRSPHGSILAPLAAAGLTISHVPRHGVDGSSKESARNGSVKTNFRTRTESGPHCPATRIPLLASPSVACSRIRSSLHTPRGPPRRRGREAKRARFQLRPCVPRDAKNNAGEAGQLDKAEGKGGRGLGKRRGTAGQRSAPKPTRPSPRRAAAII